jgi:hypothetical protein
MSDTSSRLRSWAQNYEMIDNRYLDHGRDCLEAADTMDQMRAEIKSLIAALENCHHLSGESDLRAKIRLLRGLLQETLGHVEADTAWDYESVGGYLYDRICKALSETSDD